MAIITLKLKIVWDHASTILLLILIKPQVNTTSTPVSDPAVVMVANEVVRANGKVVNHSKIMQITYQRN